MKRIICLVGVVVISTLLYFYWVILGYTLLVGFFLRIAAARAGYRPRRSSMAARLTAAGTLYTAWNTRWLKAKGRRATIPAAAGDPHQDDPIPY